MQEAPKQSSQILTGRTVFAVLVGACLGAFLTLAPFYLHALNDWDLSDKSSLFPPEAMHIVEFYSPYWLGGAALGGAAGFGCYVLLMRFRRQKQ